MLAACDESTNNVCPTGLNELFEIDSWLQFDGFCLMFLQNVPVPKSFVRFTFNQVTMNIGAPERCQLQIISR